MATDLLKEIVLGTVQFGLNYGISNETGQTPPNEVSEILKFAWYNGLSTLDTAYSYGTSEAVLGECMETDFNIITKFPYENDIAIIEKNFYQSLKLLKQKQVYGLLIHDADSFIKQPKIWDLLQVFKKDGFVKKIGFSLYYPKELELLLSFGYTPDLIQIPYNLLDRRFEPYFNELKLKGCEIHVRSVFLQGLFFLNPNMLSNFFDDVKPIIKDLRQTFQSNEELSSFLIRTCLNSKIDKVVIGVNNLSQLQNIVSGLSIPHKQFDIHVDHLNIDDKIILPFNWPKQ